jgi:hypothetical protein
MAQRSQCARSRLSGPREPTSRLDGQHSTVRGLAHVHAKFGGVFQHRSGHRTQWRSSRSGHATSQRKYDARRGSKPLALALITCAGAHFRSTLTRLRGASRSTFAGSSLRQTPGQGSVSPGLSSASAIGLPQPAARVQGGLAYFSPTAALISVVLIFALPWDDTSLWGRQWLITDPLRHGFEVGAHLFRSGAPLRLQQIEAGAGRERP